MTSAKYMMSRVILAFAAAAIFAVVQAPLAAQTITAVSARPYEGNGNAQTYSFVFRSPAGVQEFGILNGLINGTLDGGNACYFAFDWQSTSKIVWLVADGGVSQPLIGPMYLNASSGPTFLENGQCKIAKDDSSYYTRDPFNPGGGGAIYDREVVLKLNVAFKSIFGGDKAVYTAARNVSQSQNTNWRPRGAWKVAHPEPSYPKVSMLSGANSTGPFTMEISSVTTADPWRVAMLINSSVDAQNACMAVFVNELNQLWLADNSGTAFSILTIPGTGVISNTQCSINGSGTSVTRAGGKISLSINASLAPGFAVDRFVYGAGYLNTGTPSSGWRPIGVVGQPNPGVSVSFPPVSGAARLEANLGPLPIDRYNAGLNCRTSPGCISNVKDRYVSTCAHDITVRSCYQAAFQGYANQSITGLRFQFAFCGGAESTPISGCGLNTGTFSSVSSWSANLVQLYADMYAAGIRRITPTPVYHGFGGDQGYVEQSLSVCGGAAQDINWWPASPYPLDAENVPTPRFDNSAYSCAPANGVNFVGWSKIFDVIRFVIERARLNAGGVLEVSEFDVNNELRLNGFNSQGRLIVDPTRPGVDPYTNASLTYTPVLETIRKMMSDNFFDSSRVTFSVIPEDSSLNGFDCLSVYGDSGRVLSLSTLLAAIGGYQFGQPSPINYAATNVLPCGGSLAGAPVLPGPGRPGPGIIDHHHGACLRVENGQCVHYQTQENARLEARAVFNGVKALMNSFCPGGWRNPSGIPNLPLCQPLYMHGEIPLYQPNNPLLYGATCDESSLAGAAGTIAGFNSSTLVNHKLQNGATGVVFRPWVDPINLVQGTTTCYKMPHPLNQYFQTTP